MVQHANGQIAKASVLGELGQKRFDRAWSKSIADDHPVDVAGVEIACGGVDAQRTDETGAPGDRERQRGIGAAARHTKHGRVFEQVFVDGSFALDRHQLLLAVGGQRVVRFEDHANTRTERDRQRDVRHVRPCLNRDRRNDLRLVVAGRPPVLDVPLDARIQGGRLVCRARLQAEA